jgi:thioredoxin 1
MKPNMKFFNSMKHIFKTLSALLCTLLVFASCNAGNGNNNREQKENKKSEQTMVTELTKKDFLEKITNYEANPDKWVYNGKKPAIVDFFATWCGPCKGLAPVLAEVAEEYKGQIDVYKVDIDKESELASAFGIRSVPTLIFIPMEGQPQMSLGALPKSELKKAVEEILLKKSNK